MALVPGLRFQILLILAGLASASTLLSAMVALAAFDRAAAEHRAQAGTSLAWAASVLVPEQCPAGDRDCAASVIEKIRPYGFNAAVLVDPSTPKAAAIQGTGHAILLESMDEGPSAPSRHLILVFAVLNFVVLVALGGLALVRGVVKPVESLAGQVDRVGRLEFGESLGGHQIGRLGTSFRRMVGALAEERGRVERKITELEEANLSLKQAQDGLVRSEKLATVGRLSAGLAHEIGNPLGGLIGYLELLKSRHAEPSTRELVEGALSSCERIDRAIRDLLDFARPQEVTAGPFDVSRAVDEARRLVMPRVNEATIEVALAKDEIRATGDRGGMVQVLVNLLINAIDAMEGAGRVTIAVAEDERGVVVSVRDEGPGIPPDVGDEIFEPFFTTKEAGKGTGLGLAISRRIVEAWGGRLEAGTGEGAGAVFTVTLRSVNLNG